MIDSFFNFGYFSALLEFHQGAPLKTIFLFNSLQSVSIDSFLNFIGNTHTVGETCEVNIPPTIIQSYYEGKPFLCISILIPDTNARGFVRILDLVIAHDYVMPNCSSELLELMKEFQKNALELFLKEIPTYTATLEYYCNLLDDSDLKKMALLAIFKEVNVVLKNFGLKYSKEQRNINLPLDNFVILNNELRDISDLINLDENILKLRKLIAMIPVAEIGYCETKRNNNLDFGFACYSFSLYYNIIAKSEKKIIIPILVNNEALIHIIFSILAGYKVAIVSKKSKQYFNFVLWLSSFIPNFNESNISFYDGKAEMKENEKIVSCTSIDECDYLSILNLDKNFYQGLICGQNSYIWTFTKIRPKQSIMTFASKCYYLIKDYSDFFFSIIDDYQHDEFKCKQDLIEILREKKCSIDDLPMFYNWLRIFPNFSEISNYLLSPHYKEVGYMEFS